MYLLRSYVAFLAANPAWAAFGFFAAFLSSFGQTFFIALFGGEIRAAFALDHGGYGLLYSAATLASGAIVMQIGARMDRTALPRYTAAVCLGLAAACAALALAPSALWLLPAFFALRLAGQGLLSHLSMVAMARVFAVQRGKAVSFAALGHPAGEALLPVIAVALMAAVGWRGTWLIIAAVVLAVALPGLVRLVGRAQGSGVSEPPATRTAAMPRSLSLRQVLRDPLFYALSACVLAPPAILTGLLFHQVALVDAKGWSLAWFAATFAVFAAAQTAATLTAGNLVDRRGVTRLLPVYLVPLAAACAVLAVAEAPAAAAVFMALAGTTAGAGFTVMGALWAEVYGTVHLGAIRGAVQAAMVASTAAAPAVFGVLLDLEVSVEALALGCAAYAGGAALGLAALARRIARRRPA